MSGGPGQSPSGRVRLRCSRGKSVRHRGSGQMTAASEHVVDRLGYSGRPRKAGSLLAQPDLKIAHKGGVLLSANLETRGDGTAIDDALDLEQGVDAPDRFKPRSARSRR